MAVEGFAEAEAKEASTETAAALPALKNDPWACDATGFPPSFVRACFGNVAQAREKWERFREWRQQFEIDKILERPHPLFSTLQDHWTFGFLSNARNGDAVFLDRIGQIRPRELVAKNIRPTDMMHHMVFVLEFGLHHLRADPSKHLQIFIYDMEGTSTRHLGTWSIRTVRDVATLYQQNYAAHERAVLFINVSPIFSVLWRLIQPFINQGRGNIFMAGKGAETYTLLARYLDPKDIPAEYGGNLVLPRGLDADRDLIPTQARYVELIRSLNRAYPDCKEHMPVA